MKNFIKIILGVVLLAVLIQFIPIDRTLKPIDKTKNFINLENTPPNIVALLKASCYDCHSNETIYPDYAYIAPISWMVNDHIKEGRKYLNFSEWGNYNQFQKEGMLEKSVQAIANFKMPLPSYIQKHHDANLTKEQRGQLEAYFHYLKSNPSR
ncbi:heme-binding domain-containing protein [Chryseobacterium sp. T1]